MQAQHSCVLCSVIPLALAHYRLPQLGVLQRSKCRPLGQHRLRMSNCGAADAVNYAQPGRPLPEVERSVSCCSFE